MDQRTKIDLKELKKGQVIMYRLPSSQAPKDPMREWRGRIKDVWVSTRFGVGAVKVEVLDEGFNGDTEIVYPEQIVRVEGMPSISN